MWTTLGCFLENENMEREDPTTLVISAWTPDTWMKPLWTIQPWPEEPSTHLYPMMRNNVYCFQLLNFGVVCYVSQRTVNSEPGGLQMFHKYRYSLGFPGGSRLQRIHWPKQKTPEVWLWSLGRSPGEGNDNMDRGAWRATVHEVAKDSDTTEHTHTAWLICFTPEILSLRAINFLDQIILFYALSCRLKDVYSICGLHPPSSKLTAKNVPEHCSVCPQGENHPW